MHQELNISWANDGYTYNSGYGYDTYTQDVSSTDGEVIITFTINTSVSNAPTSDTNFELYAGVTGLEQGEVKFTYYNRNPLNFTSFNDDGGSSGGSTFSSYWSSTREVSMDSLEEGLVRPLKEKQRLRYYIGGSRHYIGIVGMTATSVTVNLSSTPQQATINIGETKKFEVTDDYYYDISIKLNSINTTSNEAELFIKYINESMNITTTAITNTSIDIVTTNETSPNADQEDNKTNSDTEETKIGLPKIINPLNLILFILIILGLVVIIFLIFYKKK